MFIWSVKLNRNLVWSICAVICLSIGAVSVFTPKDATDVLKNSVDTSVRTTEDQVAFLKEFGYSAEPQPLLIEEVIIPSEFDDEYEKYNNCQKLSGFNLEDYKGCRAKKYTYDIKDYSGYDGEVIANLLVYNGEVIGGDISSAELGGFTHGFVKE